MLTELSDDAIASALESIDIYQGIDKSVDNWNALEYDVRAYPYFGEPFYSAPAQAPVDESEDKSEADDGFGDNDGRVRVRVTLHLLATRMMSYKSSKII